MFVIKRFVRISGGIYMIQGDNKKSSKALGIKRKDIIGKVIFHARR